MTTRARRKTVVFGFPFLLKDIGRTLPAGGYEVLTDEELIEGLSFPVYRRVSTMMMVPAAPPHMSSTEMLTVDPRELQLALDLDAAKNTSLPAAGAGVVLDAKAAIDCP
jgi:hypothetical protein